MMIRNSRNPAKSLTTLKPKQIYLPFTSGEGQRIMNHKNVRSYVETLLKIKEDVASNMHTLHIT